MVSGKWDGRPSERRLPFIRHRFAMGDKDTFNFECECRLNNVWRHHAFFLEKIHGTLYGFLGDGNILFTTLYDLTLKRF